MPALTCPTCHLALDHAVHFCPRCGWPAGHLTVETPGSVLGLPRDAVASMPLLLRNEGAGYVEYAVRIADGQPWAHLRVGGGARRVSQTGERRLPPGGLDNTLHLGAVTAETPPDAEQLVVEIRSTDRGGATAEELRPWCAHKNRARLWRVRVPVRRLGEAEIYIGRRLAIFTVRQREVRVRIENMGGSPTQVRLQGLVPEVSARWEEALTHTDDDVLDVSFADETGDPGHEADRVTLPGSSAMDLLLRAHDDFEGLHRMTVASAEGPGHELLLYGEPSEHAATLVKRWTVGVDFGTAKSAVYVTDNWAGVDERSPEPILWPAGPSAEEATETTTRSALIYSEAADQPACGHNVPVRAGAEAENELVIESVKTQLRGVASGRAITLPGGGEVKPVDVVAQFMRYVFQGVRGSAPFRGQMDMDARFVLTLPVMDEREAFLAQRGNTLLAAEKAGAPMDNLVTAGEPECAALDLMHSLRRGDYTFGGKTYHLQADEILLVFDCGAGTTDIAVLRVLISDGKFGADQLAATGYRFGGDVVDDLLLSWLLEQRPDAQLEWQGRHLMIRLAHLSRPMPLHAARDASRGIKESLFVAGAPEHPRPFHTDLGAFEIGRAHVERLVVPFLEAMFTAGVMPDPALFFERLDRRLDDRMREALWREMATAARSRVRPLQHVLSEAGLRNSDVTFLFVTGGSGQIPIIPSRLYDFMGRSARTVVATPEDCTVNVARGASLYYDYRLSGMLRCAVDVVGRDLQSGEELFRERACAPNALPGPELERAVLLGPRQSAEIALAVEYPNDGPQGDIAARIVHNPSAEPRRLIISTQYGGDRVLCWRAVFTDGQVVIAREPVLQI